MTIDRKLFLSDFVQKNWTTWKEKIVSNSLHELWMLKRVDWSPFTDALKSRNCVIQVVYTKMGLCFSLIQQHPSYWATQTNRHCCCCQLTNFFLSNSFTSFFSSPFWPDEDVRRKDVASLSRMACEWFMCPFRQINVQKERLLKIGFSKKLGERKKRVVEEEAS